MTSIQTTTTAAGAVPAAGGALDSRTAVALPGKPSPLGATPGMRLGIAGTNFAIASSVANSVTLCLFDEAGAEIQIPMRNNNSDVWHVFVPGIGAGQAYGYRATGPYDPARGLRCNPAKLLLDPYARAMTGSVSSDPRYSATPSATPTHRATRTRPASVPRSLVVADEPFPWQDLSGPGTGTRTR